MVLTIVLLATIFALAVASSRRLTEVVAAQFNTEQLMLARQVAHNIETRFLFLRTDLSALAELAEKAVDPSSGNLPVHVARLRPHGVRDLRICDRSGRVLAAADGTPEELGTGLPRILAAAARCRPGELVAGDCFRCPTGDWMELVAVPLRDGHFVVAELDPLAIAGSAANSVRSGQTGYAFVISHEGTFLAHYEKQFVGKDAFTVRAGRNRLISFERINHLQKDYMLRGFEGTSWYYSGWHRQRHGQIKKLIAYTPAHLDAQGHYWSVAVVAPEAEVDGRISSVQFDQWLLTGLAVLVTLGGFGTAVYFSTKWSALLAAEVEAKTAALRQSESALRAERDKVTASLGQLVEAQDRLIRSERLAALGEAAAKVAHEIKNPLMVIGGFARQILRHVPAEGKEREKLGIIVDEVSRLEAMMIEVGDFTKPLKLNKRPLDLNLATVLIKDMMGEQLSAHGIDLSLTGQSVPEVSCDPEKLKQVLINLVKNATEAMPDGGLLELAVRQEDNWVCLDVRDSGKGIGPEYLERIFNPFFTTKKGGSGLGLSVCHKIIQDHGGMIDVESELNRGSTFTIKMPLNGKT
ncbi:MAG: ATP-binding protein [Pseudomonadota bacterium]